MKKAEFNNIPEKDRMNRVLEGTAFYASVHKPNMAAAKKFGSPPAFTVTLGLDEENVKKATSYGLKVHEADNFIPMPYVKIQRKVKEGKSESDVKPMVVDSIQQPVPESILIGNLSQVAVKFGTYWYDTQGGGVGTILFKMQIRKLVPFVPSSLDSQLAMDESGFTIPETIAEMDDEGFDV